MISHFFALAYIDEAEDHHDEREGGGPAEMGEHLDPDQYAWSAVRIKSMSLMKPNGTMMPPTP